MVSQCDICMWEAMYIYISTSLKLNISETKGDSGLFPIWRLSKVLHGSRMVTGTVDPGVMMSVMKSWKLNEIRF